MNLISIDDLGDEQIGWLLGRGISLFEQRGRHVGGLEQRLVFNLFFENSTRTLMSFAAAAHRLGATALTLPIEHSSVKKGETLEDTAAALDAMQPDLLVIRHQEDGAPARVAALMECPVINAGDGANEHPTQALLDAAIMQRHFGRIEGLKVAICGDIRHSRVAGSNARLLRRLGAELRFGGPPSLVPAELGALSVEEAVAGADVVMMLRVQRERLEEDLGDAPGEYLARFGLTPERLKLASPTAAVMHPGPINRDVEIASEVADEPQSLIIDQVGMGVAVRMACLELLLGTAA